MGWSSFQLPKIPAPVSSAVDGLKTVASTVSTALTLVKTMVSALSSLEVASLSASQIAVKAAVATVEAAVKSLTSDTGLYVLLVPPRSLVIIPESVKAAFSSNALHHTNVEGLKVQAMFTGEQVAAPTANILNSLFSATGGNAGFVRSVSESFDDEGDDNRPMLADTDAAAGMYIVAGSTNIASILPFTNGMSSLLAPGRPTALDAAAIPSPQGLKAKVVTSHAVRLQWTYQPPLVEIPVLGTYAKVTEIAVIRSTSVKLMSASTPQELFGSSKLSAGQKTGDGLTEVVAVQAYTGVDFKSTYLDDATHDPGAGYYYTISFHVKLGTSKELINGGGTDIGFPRLSNVVKVYLSKEDHGTPRSIEGVPPDWYRTPRVVDLFPAVGNVLNQVASLAVQFGDTTTGYSELLKANAKALEQQIKGYTDLATQLTAASSAISAFSSINLGTVSSRPFAVSGGVPAIKKDLVTAFGDTSDPNRPPFDDNEFVSGVVLLATTADAIALLNNLMSSLSAAGSVIADALAKIDVQLATIETAFFNDDMSPHGAEPVQTTSTPTTGVPQIGEDKNYCYQSYEPHPTFGDNLKPRS